MKPLHEIEMQNTEPVILDVSKKLARAVIESKPYQMYGQTMERLQNDQNARKLLSEFQKAQQDIQMLQSWGGASQEDFDKLKQLKKQLFSNPTLKEFFKAQEELVTMLKELNVLISEKLGFDFADLTKPAGGCC